MLLGIHDHFRAAAQRLMELEDMLSIARLFVPLAQTLHHHHHAEEEMLFPTIHERTGTAPDRLQADHDEMTAAITTVERALRSREGIATAVARFCEILVAHLDREEELVIPVLLELDPVTMWAQLRG